jgi:signal transduction histidine kinase
VHAAVETTRRLAAGDLSARLDASHTTDDDELAVLARSINTMAAALERSRGLERQFLMSVSHDLRTPLTSIRGYAEAIADGVGDPVRSAGVIDAEARRLERLVGDLLDLAKLDARRFDFRIADVPIASVIDAAVHSVRAVAAAADVALIVADSPDATVSADVDRLAQAIGNLSGNALKFARSTVWIRSRIEGNLVAVDVADDGAGIPIGDLPHVFERLYQASNSPQRKESGSGLGLTIVRELVEGMGGTVEVASEEGTGTTFTIRLPRVNR